MYLFGQVLEQVVEINLETLPDYHTLLNNLQKSIFQNFIKFLGLQLHDPNQLL